MHWRGHSGDMQELAHVRRRGGRRAAELARRVDAAWPPESGAERVVLDPGLGFAKTGRAQLGVARPPRRRGLGLPVLVGASRKSFLGTLLAARRHAAAERWPGGRHDRADHARAHCTGPGGCGCTRCGPNVDAARGRGRRDPEDAAPMSDRIGLAGLRVRGRHGVFDFERRDGQDFVVDVELELETRAAAASDELADTVHYGELAERTGRGGRRRAGQPAGDAGRAAGRRCAWPTGGCAAATVTVHKPQAPIPLSFADVAVTIRGAERRRMSRAVLSIGSNIGDRLGYLQLAVDGAGPAWARCRRCFETPPWGPVAQAVPERGADRRGSRAGRRLAGPRPGRRAGSRPGPGAALGPAHPGRGRDHGG